MNILTFDIEEWFHLLDHSSTKTSKEWKSFEVRIHQNMDRIFEVLELTRTKATFLVVGWIAEQYPEVVRKMVDRGYEIGSHTHMHQLVYDMGPRVFEKDLERSVKTLEDVSGQKVRIFRAPGFSITENEKWAFEIMHQYGIEIDCSVFPSHHAHGGFPSIQQSAPTIIAYNGMHIKEFPISHKHILGKNIIFSGGGYFRLFPYSFIKQWTKQSDYLMSYLHPRDFDATQPMIPDLPLSRKFKSYVGLKSATPKLHRWLTDFNFIDIATAEGMVDWEEVEVVRV